MGLHEKLTGVNQRSFHLYFLIRVHFREIKSWNFSLRFRLGASRILRGAALRIYGKGLRCRDLDGRNESRTFQGIKIHSLECLFHIFEISSHLKNYNLDLNSDQFKG